MPDRAQDNTAAKRTTYPQTAAMPLRETFRMLLDLLSARERARALALLGMILVMAVIEIAGVASIMPFVAVLSNPGVIHSNRYLSTAYQWFDFKEPETFLFILGVCVLAVVVSSLGFKALTTWAILRFTSMRNYSLSRRMFHRYLHQPYEWYLRKHSADLAMKMLQEVGNVVSAALLPALQMMAHGVVVLFLAGMLVVVDPLLAATIAICLGGAYGVIFLITRRYVAQIGEDRVRANFERYRIATDGFGGFKELKILGLEEIFLKRFEKPSLRFVQSTATHQLIAQLPQYALQAVAFGGILLIIQYQLLIHGDLTQSLPLIALYAFAGYRLLPALQQFYAAISQLRFATPALNAVHRDLTDPRMDIRDRPKTWDRLPPLRVGLELRLVSYRYPGAASRALDRLALLIPACSTIGLVGRTGAGKTTAVDVILGLLVPEEGELLVDGRSITSANKRAWQQCIGYVPQSIFLTDDTVAANIALGIPPAEIDFPAVERAARLANLHAFVTEELPKGYETEIGERGIRLAGGQRQRIGIARALYRDPDVVILDEATSSLDNVTERAVMDAVHSLSQQKTLIVIAHRLTTVKKSDKIFVFDRGQVVASGTYEQLVRESAQFREMVNSALS